MLIRSKMTITMVVMMAIVILACLGLVFANGYGTLKNAAQDKLLVLARSVESQLYTGYGKEGADGENQVLQSEVVALKTEITEILEVNIYRLAELGKVVAATDASQLGKSADPEDIQAAKEDKTVVLEAVEEGVHVLDVTYPLHYQGKIDYIVGIKTELSGEMKAIGDLLLLTLLITAAALLVVAAVVFVTVTRITRPVLSLADVVKDMSEGEGDLSASIPVRGNDEVALLAGHFNRFLHKLRAIVGSLKAVGAKSQELGGSLASNAQEVSSSTVEISSTMRSMSDRTGHLHGEIARSTEGVGEVNAFIAKVVGMIEDQSAAIDESSAAIEEMIANVGNIERSTEKKLELSQRIEGLAKACDDGMKRNVSAMDEIAQSTAVITDLIGVINSVASQTNLLAMNAAIEAAHAGDYGRGFSVVADEIRKLAEQTSSSSKDAAQTLNTIIRSIGDATRQTRVSSDSISEVIEGIVEVSEGMNETMSGLKEMSLGNRQITEALGQINKMTEEVKNAGREIREGTGRIEESFKSIAEIASENKNGIVEMAAGIGQISEAMADLERLSGENSDNIAVLDREMGKFKT
jgi:methyl-accepting chemotaxis protein